MRALSRKGSFQSQGFVLIILIGLLLPSSIIKKCLAQTVDNEAAASPDANQPSPGVDNAGASPTSNDEGNAASGTFPAANVAENEVDVESPKARTRDIRSIQNSDSSARQGGSLPECYTCERTYRDSDPHDKSWLEECVDRNSTTPTPTSQCYERKGDSSKVGCLTIQMYNKGFNKVKSTYPNATERYARRIDWKGCSIEGGYRKVGTAYPGGTPGPAFDYMGEKWESVLDFDRMECIKHLNMKLKTDKPIKCVKGVYAEEYLTKFFNCANLGYTGGSLPDYLMGIRDEGVYWGEQGDVQYFHVIICHCKTGKCNTSSDGKKLSTKAMEAEMAQARLLQESG